MSIEVMSWVWKHSQVQGSALLVLLAMADYANDDGGNIYPAIKTLALKSRLKERAVQRHISQMEESGVIVREREGVGRGNSALWRIVLNGAQNTPFVEKVHAPTEKVHVHTEKGAREGMEKVHGGAPDPSLSDPSVDPSEELSPSDLVPSAPAVEKLVPEDLQEAWNEMLVPLGLSQVASISESRRKKCLLRLREHPEIDFWQKVFAKVRGSPFLMGLTSNGNGHDKWRASFDWLIENDTNCLKIYEGRYAPETTKPNFNGYRAAVR